MFEGFSKASVVCFGFLSGASLLSAYFAERLGRLKGKMAETDDQAIEEEGTKLKYFLVLSNIRIFAFYLILMSVFVYSEHNFMDFILLVFALLNLFIAIRLTRELMRDGCRSALINTIENKSSSALTGYFFFYLFILAIDLILRIQQL